MSSVRELMPETENITVEIYTPGLGRAEKTTQVFTPDQAKMLVLFMYDHKRKMTVEYNDIEEKKQGIFYLRYSYPYNCDLVVTDSATGLQLRFQLNKVCRDVWYAAEQYNIQDTNFEILIDALLPRYPEFFEQAWNYFTKAFAVVNSQNSFDDHGLDNATKAVKVLHNLTKERRTALIQKVVVTAPAKEHASSDVSQINLMDYFINTMLMKKFNDVSSQQSKYSLMLLGQGLLQHEQKRVQMFKQTIDAFAKEVNVVVRNEVAQQLSEPSASPSSGSGNPRP
jgi:hypothetical protein